MLSDAETVVLKKDKVSLISNVMSEQMSILPVETVGRFVSLQSGTGEGHLANLNYNC